MKLIGIFKKFDKLGRIVIPKELRERYALDNEVEIIATKDGVLIKNPEYILTKNNLPCREGCFEFSLFYFQCIFNRHKRRNSDGFSLAFSAAL